MIKVLEWLPDEDELEEIAMECLEEFPADRAHAHCEVLYAAPEWLSTSEQDQFNAHLRDGCVCLVVVYLEDDSSEV